MAKLDDDTVMDRNIIKQRRQAASKVKSDNQALRSSYSGSAHGRGAPGHACEACGGPINPVEASMGPFPIHMDCVKARARAAQDGRCHCGSKKRPGAQITGPGYTVAGPGPVESRHRGGRSWIPCDRCLGAIQNVR